MYIEKTMNLFVYYYLLVLSSILDCDNYHDNRFNGKSSPSPNQQYLLYSSTPQLTY